MKISLLATPQRRPNRQLAEQKLSVVWVTITMRSSGAPSQDNGGRSTYIQNVSDTLGPFTTSRFGICGIGVEFMGQVTPGGYKGAVTMRRYNIGGSIYINSTFYMAIGGKDDTSFAVYRDDDPQSGGSGGKVYDLDAPGVGSPGDQLNVYRDRTNYREYAVLGSQSSNKMVSANFGWFDRVSCTTDNFGHLQFVADISGDNQVGTGTTNTNWNLQ